jgi:hypothetical protein
MAFNASLALALRYAAGVQAPTASTKPTSTNATAIWNDCYDEVRSAMVAAEMDPATITASSVLEGRVDQAEALLTSAGVMLAKETLGEQAIKNADRMRSRGESILMDLKRRRGFYLSAGGTAATASSGWTGSHFADDRDTTIDQTPGTGDLPYAAEAVFEWSDDD